ncbi:MAG: hypothetical protein J6Q39_00465 [Bacteroidales bacterium]|nr:hypothetical protein [Bacteroidales bacterium]
MARLLFILLIGCATSLLMGFIAGFLSGSANEQLKIKEHFDEYIIDIVTEENK